MIRLSSFPHSFTDTPMTRFIAILLLCLFTQSTFAFTPPVFSFYGNALQKGKETQHMNSIRNYLILLRDSKQKKYSTAEAKKTLSQISQLSLGEVHLINTNKPWSKIRNGKTPLICTKPILLKGVVIVGWGNGQVTKLKGNFKNLGQILKALKK